VGAAKGTSPVVYLAGSDVTESWATGLAISEADHGRRFRILGHEFLDDMNGLMMYVPEPRDQGCSMSDHKQDTLFYIEITGIRLTSCLTAILWSISILISTLTGTKDYKVSSRKKLHITK